MSDDKKKKAQKEASPPVETKEPTVPVTNKVRVATTWLDGCSGCHMSFLDLDERLIDLAGKISLVYGPLMDLSLIHI